MELRRREPRYPPLMDAREQERKQIARELHDRVIQPLVGLHHQLAHLRAAAGSESELRLVRLQGDVREALDDVRRICVNLRPPALDQLGLAAVTRAYLDELKKDAPFHITLTIKGDTDQRLDPNGSLCIFRVLQETISNVRKHARARQVNVDLHIEADEVSLMVEDDGVGFMVPQLLDGLLDDRRFGLIGMRERLDQVCGTLEVMSAPGQGTCILAWVPLPAGACLQRVNSEVHYE